MGRRRERSYKWRNISTEMHRTKPTPCIKPTPQVKEAGEYKIDARDGEGPA